MTDGDLHSQEIDSDDYEVERNALTYRIVAVSGGFAIVQPGSQLSINAVEGFPLEDFNSDVSVLEYSACFVAH